MINLTGFEKNNPKSYMEEFKIITALALSGGLNSEKNPNGCSLWTQIRKEALVFLMFTMNKGSYVSLFYIDIKNINP